MAKGRLAKILPLSADIQGTMKTAIVAGIAIQVHERLSAELQTRVPALNLGPIGNQVINGLLAVVVGGVVAQVTKKRAFGTAWALGPLTASTTSIIADLIPTPAPAAPAATDGVSRVVGGGVNQIPSRWTPNAAIAQDWRAKAAGAL